MAGRSQLRPRPSEVKRRAEEKRMEWNKTVVFKVGGAKGPAENWREDKKNNANVIGKKSLIII